ncbi:hypothetical protein GCM10011414_17900 [Croceivirga lutea]|uniref:NrtR DNA-binding winged helix domain-containing protein n=1 Tax=Croceivirga lutea TaxID=1775167 RepID=UPI00163B0362|nr:hypothetical protein [Croceivirga lutea]GGG48552.1 hypothetical protein GCM10011414_17900 [Croceivirga lutea]
MIGHQEIAENALETLKDNPDRKLVGMNLLPEKLTMKELQKVYEVIFSENYAGLSFKKNVEHGYFIVTREVVRGWGTQRTLFM